MGPPSLQPFQTLPVPVAGAALACGSSGCSWRCRYAQPPPGGSSGPRRARRGPEEAAPACGAPAPASPRLAALPPPPRSCRTRCGKPPCSPSPARFVAVPAAGCGSPFCIPRQGRGSRPGAALGSSCRPLQHVSWHRRQGSG